MVALCLHLTDIHECENPLELYYGIDDYLEKKDVKCYSAKRINLNLVRKTDIAKRNKRLRLASKTLSSRQSRKPIARSPQPIRKNLKRAASSRVTRPQRLISIKTKTNWTAFQVKDQINVIKKKEKIVSH